MTAARNVITSTDVIIASSLWLCWDLPLSGLEMDGQEAVFRLCGDSSSSTTTVACSGGCGRLPAGWTACYWPFDATVIACQQEEASLASGGAQSTHRETFPRRKPCSSLSSISFFVERGHDAAEHIYSSFTTIVMLILGFVSVEALRGVVVEASWLRLSSWSQLSHLAAACRVFHDVPAGTDVFSLLIC
ncbi:hypothetical protein Ae201684P_001372 [Aphanomyces euteiches]|uniref:Uncharacterized protein n=1 Tax=Aphanomyces euteiches TaxID=100861 RepID=A0A6G0WTG9_9STRA|nr:hypothetical protein Ae201684_011895 [Aphanomyces euteiches]KAH9089166.1 hypothetical protein Ae201684P_001372 [Aphanomyces euteiches]